MKRLFVSGILFILVIVSYISGYFYIDNTCKEADSLLEECITAYRNGEDVEEYSDRLEEFWSNKESILSVFTNHASIDEIELAIYSLSVHSNYPDNAMFYEYSGTVKTLLHQIIEDTVPGMHSIL